MKVTRRQLLGGATSLVACRAHRDAGVTTPVPEAFEACGDRSPSALSLLTWNIFMMPAWVRESPENVPRARAIGEVLLGESYDILCLQKAFDPGAREAIVRVLGARYPYRYGPANDGVGPMLSSGVWVLSRTPLTDLHEVEFDACGGVECLSRKGAMLLSGRCGGASFRLVTTHLQGEEGPHFTKANTAVRHLQMVSLRDRLLEPYRQANVPFLICGDLGTPRFFPDEGGASEGAAYREMLDTLGAENGPEARVTLDETTAGSALVTDGSGRRNELDYVLVRREGAAVRVERAVRVFKRGGWDRQGRTDLSYRYAVSARVEIASAPG